MKLIKCYVSSFGKLKNFTYEFADGLNTIKEDNGWGKTTLATFVKAMFYGISGSKRSVAENERLKYRPWNSNEMFGGYIHFEWGGNEYKIERFFGAKESDDTVRLSDVKTGKFFQNTENLGKRIFEIDEEGFLSTTYFSQKDFQVKSNTSITAKFNSICEVQDSEAFDKAIAKVEDKSKKYKYRGDKGLISEAQKDLFLINEEIERVERTALTCETQKLDVIQLENQVGQLNKKIVTLTERISETGKAEAESIKIAHYNKLLKDQEILLSKIDSNEKILGETCPLESELSAYSECNNELIKINANCTALDAEIDRLKLEKDSTTNENKSKKPIIITAIFAILFLIDGLTTVWFNVVLGIIGFVLAILSFVAFCVLFNLFKKEKQGTGVISNMLDSRRKQLAEYQEIRDDYVNKLESFIKRFNVDSSFDYAEAISFIKQTASEQKRIKNDLEVLNNEISKYSFDKNNKFDNEKVVESLASLEKQLKDVQEDYRYKATSLAERKAALKRNEDFVAMLPELESKKADLVQKIAQYKEEYNILTLTAEYLKKADENLKVRYRAPLQDSLKKYLSLMSGEDKEIKIDVDMSVTIEENGVEKVPDYYSKGYQNLFEICKRFALTDVIFKGEKPFIILDDPFYNLDDDKLDLSLELIKKLSKEYQILYFVCHESRRA